MKDLKQDSTGETFEDKSVVFFGGSEEKERKELDKVWIWVNAQLYHICAYDNTPGCRKTHQLWDAGSKFRWRLVTLIAQDVS